MGEKSATAKQLDLFAKSAEGLAALEKTMDSDSDGGDDETAASVTDEVS